MLNNIKRSYLAASYNHVHNILRLSDILPNVSFTISEMMRDYYQSTQHVTFLHLLLINFALKFLGNQEPLGKPHKLNRMIDRRPPTPRIRKATTTQCGGSSGNTPHWRNSPSANTTQGTHAQKMQATQFPPRNKAAPIQPTHQSHRRAKTPHPKHLPTQSQLQNHQKKIRHML